MIASALAYERAMQQTVEASRPIPQDLWGLAFFVLVTDFARLIRGKADRASLACLLFTVSAIMLNLWLQFTTLWYINQYVVGEQVHLTQTHYKQFHHDVFDADGEFVQEKWDAWDGPSMELCSMAMTKFNFSLAIVFLWSGRMLGELRNIDRLHRDIYAIQGLGEDSDISDMVKDVEGDEGEATGSRVVALTTVARVSTYVLIIIPKVIIAMVLLALGCRWLASTESFADLILNALALEFVIGIDELMYESFVPEAMRLRLEASTVVHKKANRGTDDAKTESAIEFTRSLVYMTVCGVWSYVYLEYLQQVLPDFKHDIHQHCHGSFDRNYEPICAMWQRGNCFPYGDGE